MYDPLFSKLADLANKKCFEVDELKAQLAESDAVTGSLVDALDGACEDNGKLMVEVDNLGDRMGDLRKQLQQVIEQSSEACRQLGESQIDRIKARAERDDLRKRLAELERDLHVASTNRDVARRERDEARAELARATMRAEGVSEPARYSVVRNPWYRSCYEVFGGEPGQYPGTVAVFDGSDAEAEAKSFAARKNRGE